MVDAGGADRLCCGMWYMWFCGVETGFALVLQFCESRPLNLNLGLAYFVRWGPQMVLGVPNVRERGGRGGGAC